MLEMQNKITKYHHIGKNNILLIEQQETDDTLQEIWTGLKGIKSRNNAKLFPPQVKGHGSIIVFGVQRELGDTAKGL